MDGCSPSQSDRPLTLEINRPRYRELVKAKGWTTQKQQAEALGVAQHTVSRVIEGHTRPSTRFLAALITAFPDEDMRDLVQVVEDLPLRRVAA